jgi:hypothetical protein
VKESNACSKLRGAGKIRVLSFLPSLVDGAPLEMKEGTIEGENTISHQAAVLYRPRKATFIFILNRLFYFTSVALMIAHSPTPPGILYLHAITTLR